MNMKELIRVIKQKRSARVFLTEFLNNKIYYLQNSDLQHIDYYIYDEMIFKHNKHIGRLYVHVDLYNRVNYIEKISCDYFVELLCELSVGKLYNYKYVPKEITVIIF